MRDTLKRAGLLALVVLLATAAASATVQLDSETTNTATTSDVHSTAQVVDYNESATIYLEAQVEGTDPAFKLVDPETNETIAYKNGTDVTQQYSDTSTAPNTYYYSTNISQSKLSTVEMGAGENKTFNLTVINDSTATNPKTTSLDVFVHNENKRTYLKLEDSEVGDNGLASLVTETVAGYQLPYVSQETAKIDQSVPTNGSGTTATIDVKNSTLADRLSQSAEDKTSEDWIPSTIAKVDGEAVRVYMDSAPSDVSNETHVVYHSGSDELEINFGDDYTGSSSDVVIDANRGFRQQFDAYGLDVFQLPSL